MTIDLELIQSLEALSAIALTEAERAAALADLQAAVESFAPFAALDTDGVEPLTHVLPLENVTREDIALPSMDNELLLANAARVKGGAFVVHRAVE